MQRVVQRLRARARAAQVHDRIYVLERAARRDWPPPAGVPLDELIVADRQLQALRQLLDRKPDAALIDAVSRLLDDPQGALYHPRAGGHLSEAIREILERDGGG